MSTRNDFVCPTGCSLSAATVAAIPVHAQQRNQIWVVCGVPLLTYATPHVLLYSIVNMIQLLPKGHVISLPSLHRQRAQICNRVKVRSIKLQ